MIILTTPCYNREIEIMKVHERVVFVACGGEPASRRQVTKKGYLQERYISN